MRTRDATDARVNADEETTSYLGYPVRVTREHVYVLPPRGRPVRVASMKQARLFVKGYRKTTREA